MNRQQIIGTAVIALILVGVWATSREPAPPADPGVTAVTALPTAAAAITTMTAAPTVTASPTWIVLTFEPEATDTAVYVPPTAAPPTVEAPPAQPAVTEAAPAAPPPTAYVPPPPPPPDPSVAGAEQGLIDQVNYQRALIGLAPYARDESLMQIARGRVADMIARGYFGHTDPITGESLARSQITALGYTRAGENILRTGSSLADLPANAVAWFMSDQVHRDNILHPAYTVIGTGVAADGNSWDVVLVFAS